MWLNTRQPESLLILFLGTTTGILLGDLVRLHFVLDGAKLLEAKAVGRFGRHTFCTAGRLGYRARCRTDYLRKIRLAVK